MSFSFVLTDVVSNKNRFNWHPFPSRMCFFRNHSLCVSVLLNRWQPPILVSRLIAVMSPLPLRELDVANVTLAHPAATGRRHYCTFGSMKCLFLVVGGWGGALLRVCKRVNPGQRKHRSPLVLSLACKLSLLPVIHTPPTRNSVRLQLRRGIFSMICCHSHLVPPQVELNRFQLS